MKLARYLAALCLVCLPLGAWADWPQKPITFIVPSKAGGGFDSYARAIVPALEDILGVDVIVRNVIGGAGRKGAVTVSQAAPDGYTIGIFNMPGQIVPHVLGAQTGYDLGKVTWLANLARSPLGLGVRAGSTFDSFEALCSQEEPFTHSDTGVGSSSWIIGRISMRVADCDYRVIAGYKGAVDSIVAVMRGDAQATIKPLGTLRPFRESGDIKILMSLEDERSFPDVPTAAELGHPELAQFAVQRLVGAPPELPEEVRQKLSDALVTAAQAPSTRAWASKLNRPLDPVGWREAQALVAALIVKFSEHSEIFSETVN